MLLARGHRRGESDGRRGIGLGCHRGPHRAFGTRDLRRQGLPAGRSRHRTRGTAGRAPDAAKPPHVVLPLPQTPRGGPSRVARSHARRPRRRWRRGSLLLRRMRGRRARDVPRRRDRRGRRRRPAGGALHATRTQVPARGGAHGVRDSAGQRGPARRRRVGSRQLPARRRPRRVAGRARDDQTRARQRRRGARGRVWRSCVGGDRGVVRRGGVADASQRVQGGDTAAGGRQPRRRHG